MPSVEPLSQWLTLDVCPNCGYSLRGSPAAGVCPECGRSYDPSEVILYGWARGQHENIANAKPSRVLWLILVSFVWMMLQMGPQLIFHARQALACAAVVTAVVIFFLSRRRSTEHPGQIQIRLTDAGCVQYDDLAGPSAVRELFYSHGWLIAAAGIVVLIIAMRLDAIAAVTFWILLPVVTIWLIFSWRACSRFRKALKEVRDGAIADAAAAYYRVTPWAQVSTFSLMPAGIGNYRLRIDAPAPFLRFSMTQFAVDAEISCTVEQAQELRDLLSSRVNSARAIASTVPPAPPPA